MKLILLEIKEVKARDGVSKMQILFEQEGAEEAVGIRATHQL